MWFVVGACRVELQGCLSRSFEALLIAPPSELQKCLALSLNV